MVSLGSEPRRTKRLPRPPVRVEQPPKPRRRPGSSAATWRWHRSQEPGPKPQKVDHGGRPGRIDLAQRRQTAHGSGVLDASTSKIQNQQENRLSRTAQEEKFLPSSPASCSFPPEAALTRRSLHFSFSDRLSAGHTARRPAPRRRPSTFVTRYAKPCARGPGGGRPMKRCPRGASPRVPHPAARVRLR